MVGMMRACKISILKGPPPQEHDDEERNLQYPAQKRLQPEAEDYLYAKDLL